MTGSLLRRSLFLALACLALQAAAQAPSALLYDGADRNDKLAAAASFTYQNTGVCFFGHTHVPVAFIRENNMVRGGTYSKFKVEPGKKYFVNVGAVGQPRDNNPKAGYVVYDLNENTIELRRLDYDIAATQRKILAAGLPERLAERLEFGR